jgi:predicted metal-dependent peptidase
MTDQMEATRMKALMALNSRIAFFGEMAMRLRIVKDETIPTAATDGTNLFYNPQWFGSLDDDTRLAVLAHEIMHCVLGHFARMGNRALQRWNLATDASINPLLVRSGFRLPDNVVYPDRWNLPEFETAEWYDEHIPKEEGKGKGQRVAVDLGGVKRPDPDADPSVGESDGDSDATAEEWRQAAKDGLVKAGTEHSEFRRMMDKVIEARTRKDWRTIIREYLDDLRRDDFSWSRPNKRHVHRNVVLPSQRSYGVRHLVLALDASGSMCGILDRVLETVKGLVEQAGQDVGLVSILFHDTQIMDTFEFRPGEGYPIKGFRAGGGTSHDCVFRHVATMGETPSLLVVVSDFHTSGLPKQAPGYPVLWVATPYHGRVPKWGREITMGRDW